MCHASALAAGDDQEKICTAVLAIVRRFAALAPTGFGDQPDSIYARIAKSDLSTSFYPLRRKRRPGPAKRYIVDQIYIARCRGLVVAGRSCRGRAVQTDSFTLFCPVRAGQGFLRSCPARQSPAGELVLLSIPRRHRRGFSHRAHTHFARRSAEPVPDRRIFLRQCDIGLVQCLCPRSDALEGMAELRGIEPAHEAVSLSDYRKRYASYRADPALQELHRRFPIIVMWDDHETANNSWNNGAANHDPVKEGRWKDRMAAGVQAFYEWLPMRGKPYSEYQLGDLATLFRLETRLIGRSEQLDLQDAIKGHEKDLAAAAIAFRDGPLNDPARTMMGAEQEQWLADGLAASTASGRKWQILAQQVIMGRSRIPEDFAVLFGPDDRVSAKKLEEMKVAANLSAIDVPQHMDRWEGYPAARQRLLQASQNANADLVVLSGDSHNAWAFNLEHGDQPVGVELAVQGVSSLGMDKRFHGDPIAIAKRFVDASPDLVWCDTSQRGYMVLDVQADHISNEWLFIPSRIARTAKVSGTHRMQVARGKRKLTPSKLSHSQNISG